MNQVIYQLYTGRQQAANTLDHPGDVLSRMKDFDWQNLGQGGFDIVYLLGLFDSRGPILVTEEDGVDLEGREHRVPSIFALSNHAAVHPILGTDTDLRELIQVIQSQTCRVMVDFVPNHTGLSHPWITDHPTYYVYDGEAITREFSGDVAKLNYANPQLRREMITILLWIASLGVDGVRCDMAHLVPTDFWAEAITAVRQEYPAFLFVAEAYPNSLFDLSPLTALLKAGFDAVYHEPLYRNLRSGSWADVEAHLAYFLQELNPAQFIHYLSNHDDPVPPNLPKNVEEIMTLLLSLPGSVLIYNGLFHGFTRRLSHHAIDILPASMCELTSIPPVYRHLLQTRRERIGVRV
jgi:alpha-amylase